VTGELELTLDIIVNNFPTGPVSTSGEGVFLADETLDATIALYAFSSKNGGVLALCVSLVAPVKYAILGPAPIPYGKERGCVEEISWH
jgi:hypothetical protein